MSSSEALLYLGPSSAMKQWSTPLLPTGQRTQKHNHSAARQKYHSFHPPLGLESVWEDHFIRTDLLLPLQPRPIHRKYIFQHSNILFALSLYNVKFIHLATDYGTVSWPVTPDMFISVTSHFLECPLKAWFVESGKGFTLAKLAGCPASVQANVDELGH